jgi:hypothetical protein
MHPDTIRLIFHVQEQVSSRAPTFENCYIPQANMEEPELGSRATTLGVYYSTQQTNQGVGAHYYSVILLSNNFYITVSLKLIHCSCYSGSSHRFLPSRMVTMDIRQPYKLWETCILFMNE